MALKPRRAGLATQSTSSIDTCQGIAIPRMHTFYRAFSAFLGGTRRSRYYNDKVACRAGGIQLKRGRGRRGRGEGARKSLSIIRGMDIKQIECGSTRSLVYNDINASIWMRVNALSSNARVRACVRSTHFTRFRDEYARVRVNVDALRKNRCH